MTHESQTARGSGGSAGGTGAMLHQIEKGWTVYDAIERPVGNVTDVDAARSTLQVDGRPAGFDAFEVPLRIVARAGDGEVRLSQVVDVEQSAGDAVPRFVAVPAEAMSTTRSERIASRAGEDMAGAEPTEREAGRPAPPTGSATVDPSVVGGASRTYTADGRPVQWEARPEPRGSNTGQIVAGAVGAAGLAALAAYVIRRRRRRTTLGGRIVDALLRAFGSTAEFVGDRRPAWWASALAILLPAAYYAWPSSRSNRDRQRPTTGERLGAAGQRLGERVDTLSGGLSSSSGMLARWIPAADDVRAAARRTLPSEWTERSMRPDLLLTGGLLAASALAFYLARRGRSPRPGATRIADVMTRRPRVVQPDATVADAAQIMRQLDVGALPVCDGSRLIGMLTDRDITVRATADGRDPHHTSVRDVMTPGVAWASEDDPVEAAARIMREHRIRRLPIVDDRHTLVGVVSLGDLAVDLDDNDLGGDTLETISEPARPDR